MTPFTKKGRAQGGIAEQYTRKTILTVPETFPAMLKRQPVISRYEVIQTPIQNSVETIEKRSSELLQELKSVPPQIKSLQNVLQGSVLLRK